MPAVSDFVSATLGPQFIVTSATDLAACYDDSNATTPLVFVLSQGSDPTSALLQFAGAPSSILHTYGCVLTLTLLSAITAAKAPVVSPLPITGLC